MGSTSSALPALSRKLSRELAGVQKNSMHIDPLTPLLSTKERRQPRLSVQSNLQREYHPSTVVQEEGAFLTHLQSQTASLSKYFGHVQGYIDQN